MLRLVLWGRNGCNYKSREVQTRSACDQVYELKNKKIDLSTGCCQLAVSCNCSHNSFHIDCIFDILWDLSAGSFPILWESWPNRDCIPWSCCDWTTIGSRPQSPRWPDSGSVECPADRDGHELLLNVIDYITLLLKIRKFVCNMTRPECCHTQAVWTSHTHVKNCILMTLLITMKNVIKLKLIITIFNYISNY